MEMKFGDDDDDDEEEEENNNSENIGSMKFNFDETEGGASNVENNTNFPFSDST